MTRTSLPAGRLTVASTGIFFGGLWSGTRLLYALGYLSKSVAGPAAIWPAHALAFAAFMLLPLRAWPLIVIGMVVVGVAGADIAFPDHHPVLSVAVADLQFRVRQHSDDHGSGRCLRASCGCSADRIDLRW